MAWNKWPNRKKKISWTSQAFSCGLTSLSFFGVYEVCVPHPLSCYLGHHWKCLSSRTHSSMLMNAWGGRIVLWKGRACVSIRYWGSVYTLVIEACLSQSHSWLSPVVSETDHSFDLEKASPPLGLPRSNSIDGASQVTQWWRIHLASSWPKFGPWVGKILWRRKWQPTPGFLPWKAHGQWSLGRQPVGLQKSWTWLSG